MTSIAVLSLLFLAQVPEFTSASVADATEKLTGRPAQMTSGIHVILGARLLGPAVTLGLVRDEKASVMEAGLATIKLLESAPAGSVVVAALNDEKSFAVFGSTFAALAKTRKLAGFVVDGSVRDIPDLNRLALPIFARGTTAGSAGGHYRIAITNAPVQCGGIEVKPGDYVAADEDGVAVIPKDRYEEVLIAARKVQSEKLEMIRLIEKTGSYTKALAERNAAGRQP
jgi:4-hydroxy-4-methyl-2-oxoglutarate aldolase